MVPPGAKSGLPPNAPLRQWRHVGSFDSAGECEHVLNEVRRDESAAAKAAFRTFHAKRDDQHAGQLLHALAVEKTANASQCIASNDPRLKGN
jgi:hypothetical protein